MDEMLARTPSGAIEHICALAARAAVHAELLEVDLAAADGLAAYTMAENAGLVEQRVQAAGSLATIYRRSGLVAEADRMINEVIVFERAADRPAQVAAALYLRGQIRIEAVTNAARHSGCSKIDIELRLNKGTLVLTVADNGTGLRAEVDNSEGRGLKTMAYRARLLGGSFLIEPGPEHGWRIVTAVPMA